MMQPPKEQAAEQPSSPRLRDCISITQLKALNALSFVVTSKFELYVRDECFSFVMANGYSLLKEQYMGIPAATFYEEVQAVVILFDFRKIGLSSGEPRSEVIPSEQLDDYVNVITFARNQSYIKPNNIGIWGISMSGGHVLNLGTWWGHYLGIQAVVAVVPSIRVMYTADLLFTAGGVNGFFRPLMGTARQDLYDSGGNFYASYSDEWGVNMSTQYFPTVSENCAEDLNCFFTVPPSYEWFVNASVYKPDSCGNATCQWMNISWPSWASSL